MKKLLEGKYFRIGLMIFATGAALILFREIVGNFDGFKGSISSITGIVAPFIYGFVIAYLMSPIYNFGVKCFYKLFAKKAKNKKRALTISKAISTFLSIVILVGVVGGILALMIPQLVDSVVGIVTGLPGRLRQVSEFVTNFTDGMKNQELAARIKDIFAQAQEGLLSWAQNKLLPSIGTIASQASSTVMLTLKTVMNMIIGVVACAYFLNGKERFRAQIKKTIMGIFKEETCEKIFNVAKFTDRTFGGFITGKIIDSLIIGVLCFIAMTVLGLPYPMLISTMIGVTNIIPFFGPFIGAVPAAIIILLISPIQAFVFIILVVVLQTLDGYVIGPRILGSSIGIGSFWVMFAIIVGGGLFGFMGMVVGVPIFAVIYYYLGEWMAKRLKDKGLESSTESYIEMDEYGIDREDVPQ